MRTGLVIAAMLILNPWQPPGGAPALSAETASPHPDLSGVWTNASLTKLTRPPGWAKLVATRAEAEKIEASSPMVRSLDADAKPTDPMAGAPAVGDPGGYNAGWLDPGRTLGRFKGEYRTSWIVDPADGQLPLSAEGRRRVAEAEAFASRAATPSDPEQLEPWDRCLISSRGSGGPGMLNNIYNSNYEIVQTPTAVAIIVEMVHDTRIVPIFPDRRTAQAHHRSRAVQLWLGDSVGWWEGTALVVETTNVNREQGRAGPIFMTPEGRVTERFERRSAREIAYTFIVEDYTYYSRPWQAEMTLSANPSQLYEYACHEGNYAMSGILNGARASDTESARPVSAARNSSQR